MNACSYALRCMGVWWQAPPTDAHSSPLCDGTGAEAKEREKEQAEQAEKLGETLEEAGIRTRRQKQKGMVRASRRWLWSVWVLVTASS